MQKIKHITFKNYANFSKYFKPAEIFGHLLIMNGKIVFRGAY